MNMNAHRIICLLVLFVFATSFANAQEVRVDIFAEPDSLRVGDVLKLTFEIKHDAEIQLQLPDLRISLLPIEVGEPIISREENHDGVLTERFEFEAFLFDTGTVVIPSQKIVYWNESDSSNRKTIYTDSLWIYVKSVLTADAQEIRDIKEPVEIPQPFGHWMLVFGIMVAIAILAVAYYLWRKRNNKPIIPFKKPFIIKPAHEIALKALFKLEKENLIEKEKISPYFTELSKILREYIENRYFLKALEMTTTEMLDAIEKERLYDVIGDTVKSVLTESDLVKFARFKPEISVGKNLFDNTVSLVEKTKVVPIDNNSGNVIMTVPVKEDEV